MKALATLKSSVAPQIKGTQLEPLARWIWDRFNPPSPKVIANRQKQAYMKQAPVYMEQIMEQVLTKESNCLDIGCHQGAVLSEMLRLAPLGHHCAFEPIPSLAENLERQFPQVELRQMALSNSEGEVEFHHVVSRPGYSGLKRRPYPSSNETVEIIKVQTQKLDNILPTDLQVDFIKVDVEGAQLQVFQGAIQTIKKYKPYILFEHGPLASKSYGTTSDMIYELLVRECGLKLFGLKNWLNNSSPFSQQEFAAIQGSIWDFLATP